jgi:hypothetical protein
MLRLTVTTTLPSRKSDSSRIWFTFETDMPDIEAVYEQLRKERCIFGQKVMTDPARSGPRLVRSRAPIVLGLDAIATIAPCHLEYVEPALEGSAE